MKRRISIFLFAGCLATGCTHAGTKATPVETETPQKPAVKGYTDTTYSDTAAALDKNKPHHR